MSIFGQFYPLKDMIKNIENDQLDELYNSTKAVFWFPEVVQKSVSSLQKSANGPKTFVQKFSEGSGILVVR